jgi:hypothetical protein
MVGREPEGRTGGGGIGTFGGRVAAEDKGRVLILHQGVVAEKTGKFYGVKMTTGDIYTIGPKSDANDLGVPEGLIFDPSGNIVFAGAGNNIVYLLATSTGTDDGISVKAKHLYAIAGNGTLGDTGNGGDPQKAELNSPCAVATDTHGDLIITDGGHNVIRQIAP